MGKRINGIDNVVFMQPAVPAHFWQDNGLTLLYPYSCNQGILLN